MANLYLHGALKYCRVAFRSICNVSPDSGAINTVPSEVYKFVYLGPHVTPSLERLLLLHNNNNVARAESVRLGSLSESIVRTRGAGPLKITPSLRQHLRSGRSSCFFFFLLLFLFSFSLPSNAGHVFERNREKR